MIDSISKPKQPKGLAYVLQTSQLEKALSDEGLDCHVDLQYWLPHGGGSILEAHYWLPNPNVPYPRVYVRAGVVPIAKVGDARAALATVALPRFIAWLREIVDLPADSPALYTKPYFNATYTDAGLANTNQPTYKIPRRQG